MPSAGEWILPLVVQENWSIGAILQACGIVLVHEEEGLNPVLLHIAELCLYRLRIVPTDDVLGDSRPHIGYALQLLARGVKNSLYRPQRR